MQTFKQRLEILRKQFGIDFGVFQKVAGRFIKPDMLLFGYNKTEFIEADALVGKLRKQPLTNLVELGVNWGASLFMYSRFLAPGSTIVGVDCGLYPGIHDVHKVLDYLRDKEGHTVHFLNMTTGAAIPKVKELLPTVDFLHIDAGHSYVSAKHDWTNYTPMVAPGGLIVMHDVATPAIPEVGKFWREIRDNLPQKYEVSAPAKKYENRHGVAVVVKTW